VSGWLDGATSKASESSSPSCVIVTCCVALLRSHPLASLRGVRPDTYHRPGPFRSALLKKWPLAEKKTHTHKSLRPGRGTHGRYRRTMRSFFLGMVRWALGGALEANDVDVVAGQRPRGDKWSTSLSAGRRRWARSTFLSLGSACRPWLCGRNAHSHHHVIH
jgi:hypothetical protein